jgi:hypothetical protein
MKVLVCGSRNWVEQKPIEEELRKLPPGTILIHGGCRGADNIAGYVGEQLGFTVRVYPANWDLYGPQAGILRNQQMLDEEHQNEEPIDLVLAFHEDPGLGRGTKDMVERAERVGIETRVLLAA